MDAASTPWSAGTWFHRQPHHSRPEGKGNEFKSLKRIHSSHAGQTLSLSSIYTVHIARFMKMIQRKEGTATGLFAHPRFLFISRSPSFLAETDARRPGEFESWFPPFTTRYRNDLATLYARYQSRQSSVPQAVSFLKNWGWIDRSLCAGEARQARRQRLVPSLAVIS